MGGAAPVDSGRKGRKSLDAELNLVPFIDLLSCLISFLLITAVWTQVSTLKVSGTQGLDADGDPPPPRETVDVRVTMSSRGFVISVAGQPEEISRLPQGAFDQSRLAARMKEVKAAHPDQESVTVMSEDEIAFEDLAATIDGIEAAGMEDVQVTPALN